MHSSYSYVCVMQRLTGKVAIVTASSYGIGFAIAKRLAEEGACVTICSRDAANVNRALERLRESTFNVLGIQCHVANASQRKRLFDETIQRFGRLDILVSNAATNPAVKPVLDSEESAWDKIFEVNVKSSFLLVKEALPYMRKEGAGGSIVIVSSIVGYDPPRSLGAYSVSKTALLGLTKAASKQLSKEGIRVNCVAPGIIETRFSSSLIREKGGKALRAIAMGRFGKPDELAGVVAFLVSDDASYITGETIVAGGGLASRL